MDSSVPLSALFDPDDQEQLSYGIPNLCAELESYLDPSQIREVYRAYLYGAEAHEGQQRKSGEPYICHPVAVARLLASMRMDASCLMAAVLHDVIEDTGVSKEQLAAEFGEEVAELVDGVSKLTQIDFSSHAEAQAANFRKMLLAMTRDMRVILIKLADRLHNMNTLDAMRAEKQRRIARETLEIYAPIANRLGIHHVRLELEELGFSYAWPMRYRVLKEAVRKAMQHNRELVSNVEMAIARRMQQEGIDGTVEGREKHLYSIFQKMREKSRPFSEVVDMFGFRVVVDKADNCYRALGMMHSLYKPMPGRFKDYIAIPKSNGYQSLHTVLFGPQGNPIEIQIRTRAMDRVAKYGVAAHWLYKESRREDKLVHGGANDWIKDLLEMQQGAGNSIEFLENVKIDIFPDEVYVFTPRGEIKVLPKGATVIDFAYAVHSDVGDRCVAAMVERRFVPLRTRLYNGQTVDVITKEDAHPNPGWLDFVVSGKSRTKIRAHLKNLQHRDAVELGRRLVVKALRALNQSPEELEGPRMDVVLEAFHVASTDDLLEQVGLGNRMPLLVAKQIAEKGADTGAKVPPLVIRGTEGMAVKLSKCCKPIPGDEILAFFSPGQGVVVHRQDCRNIPVSHKKGEEWLDVRWETEPEGEFTTEIRVAVSNKRGVLASLASHIADVESNIENVVVDEKDGLSTTLLFTLSVRGRRHLAQIMRGLRAVPEVMRIGRVLR